MHVTLPPHVKESDHNCYLLMQQVGVKYYLVQKMTSDTMETKQTASHAKMSRWVEHILYEVNIFSFH